MEKVIETRLPAMGYKITIYRFTVFGNERKECCYALKGWRYSNKRVLWTAVPATPAMHKKGGHTFLPLTYIHFKPFEKILYKC